jgi:WRKY transcription factor 2
MARIDDNLGIILDWVPPSPSPGAFFLATLGYDIHSPPGEDTN